MKMLSNFVIASTVTLILVNKVSFAFLTNPIITVNIVGQQNPIDTSGVIQSFNAKVDRIVQANNRIYKLSPAQQRREVVRLPKGVYVQIPAYWQLQNDPNELLDAVRFFGEPLNNYQVDALERLFPKFTNYNQRLQVGAILYRYRHEVGRKYLIQRTTKYFDAQAARILVLNKEEITYDSRLFHMIGSSEFVRAIQGWKKPEFIEPILHLLETDTENRPYIISAVAALRMYEALPWLEKRFADPKCTTIERVYVAVAIMTMKPETQVQMSQYIDATYSANVDEETRLDVVSALGNGNSELGITYFRRAIQEYLDLATKTAEITPDAIDAEVVAVNACMALSDLHNKEDSVLVEKVLDSLNKFGRRDMYESELSRSLYKLNPNSKILEKVIGRDGINRLSKMKGLRRIPDGLKPDGEIIIM